MKYKLVTTGVNENPDARLSSPHKVYKLVIIRQKERVTQVRRLVELLNKDIRCRFNGDLVG